MCRVTTRARKGYENGKIAVPLVEPAAKIHHSNAYWVKNKSADMRGPWHETEENEKREEGGWLTKPM